MKRTSTLLAFSLLALAARAHAEPRKVDGFRAIEIAGLMEVDVAIGATTSVDVQGNDATLVKLVSTTVKNGTLVIDTPKDFQKLLKGKKRDLDLKVVVTMPKLDALAITGIGAIEVEGLAQKSLDVSIPGTGSVELAGKAERFKLSVPGTGAIKAKNLIASEVALSVPGTVQAVVHASKSFDVDVQGTAAVKVFGKPASVKRNVNGTAAIDVQ